MFLTACMRKAEKILTGEFGQHCSFSLTARVICLTKHEPDTQFWRTGQGRGGGVLWRLEASG